jgi:integrase
LEPIAVNRNNSVPDVVSAYVRQAFAENTKRAYMSDIRQFEAIAGPLPATDLAVATYIATVAPRMKVSTLDRRLASLSKVHQLRGWPNPVRSPLVRSTLQGIRRVHRSQPQQARALVVEDLAIIIASLGDTLRDQRDRTLLLIGFAGGFRRSELVSLDVEDLSFSSQGVLVRLRRSKTDQLAVGRTIAIPRGPDGLCPMTALRDWIGHSGIGQGAVFRAVARNGRLGPRLSGSAVNSILKARLSDAGFDPTGYSGHSLRAGLVTSATLRGVTEHRIRLQTGHGSAMTMNGYVRPTDLWTGNPAGMALRSLGRGLINAEPQPD